MCNSCITHRLIYAKTCIFLVLSSVLISHFQITSVYIVVARWMNLRKKWCLEHELQLSDYIVWKYFTQMYVFLVERYYLPYLLKKIVLVGHFTSFLIHYYCMDTNFLFIHCSRVTHYANIPMQYTAIFHCCINGNFSVKNMLFFLIFPQIIDCGYTLEPPQ